MTSMSDPQEDERKAIQARYDRLEEEATARKAATVQKIREAAAAMRA